VLAALAAGVGAAILNVLWDLGAARVG